MEDNYDYIYKDDDKWYISKIIQKITNYNGQSITTPYISTTGQLSNGATVYYVGTRTDTEITDTTLKGQLEAILTAGIDRDTTEYSTTIDSDVDCEHPILDITVLRDIVDLEVKEVDRIINYKDKIDAVKQAAYKILMTERYAYPIYDKNYGVELEQYIGKGFDYLEATIEKTLNEALTHDLRIYNAVVTNIEKIDNDKAHIYFTIYSVYGDLQMEVSVNV